MTKRSPESVEERIALLQQTHFGPTRELKPTDPLEPTPLVVTIERMKEYDRNPRREPNQAYDVIKQSIRQRGFRGTLPITRRPGDELYMVAEGGNTVLHIVKELHEETGDPRFFTIHCLFEPWVSESETLIAHLVENDAREIPTSKEGKRIALWWFLSAVSEQWPYDEGRLDMAPALSYHEHSRIYPLFEAVVRRDNATAERIVVPLLNNIVTLDIASRQLFAVFGDREFELFIRLIETRRALHVQCRRLGNTLVWDL